MRKLKLTPYMLIYTMKIIFYNKKKLLTEKM